MPLDQNRLRDRAEYGDKLLSAPLVLQYDEGTGAFRLVTSPNYDDDQVGAFGRLRTIEPFTLFDSKQLYDSDPIRWDDQQTVGATGTASTSYDQDHAMTTIGVDALVSAQRTRQTIMRFGYQPGKSQLIMMTGIIGAGAPGITSRIGQFDGTCGLFFENKDADMGVVLRTQVTGSVIDTRIAQADWNENSLKHDPSIDWSKSQIFVIDYEWLGVGRVRFGIVMGGRVVYCHYMDNQNILNGAYMRTPNLPLRYQISNDGTGPAATVGQICSTVIAEGGVDQLGILRVASTVPTPVDAQSADTSYVALAIRLKSTHLSAIVRVIESTMINTAGDDYQWSIRLNPTIAGSLSFADEANSAVQIAHGATANTVTGGLAMAGGLVKASGSSGQTLNELKQALYLGSKIDGTRDVIALCVTPLTNGAHIHATLQWRES